MPPLGALTKLEELEALVKRAQQEPINLYWAQGPTDYEVTTRILDMDSSLVHEGNGNYRLWYKTKSGEKKNLETRVMFEYFYLFTNYFHTYGHSLRQKRKL